MTGSVPEYSPGYSSLRTFFEPAEMALSFLKDLKGLGEVHVLHVMTKGETNEEVESNSEDATKKLEKIINDLSGAGLSVKVHILLGRPTDEIVSLVEAENISPGSYELAREGSPDRAHCREYHAWGRHPHQQTLDGHKGSGQVKRIRGCTVPSIGVAEGKMFVTAHH